MNRIIFNGITFKLLKVENLSTFKGIKYSTSVSEPVFVLENLLIETLRVFGTTFEKLIYKLDVQFNSPFEGGIVVSAFVHPIFMDPHENIYSLDDDKFQVIEYFKTDLHRALEGKLTKEYSEIFLRSLLIYLMQNVNLAQNVGSMTVNLFCKSLYERISSLTNEDLNSIVNVITHRKVTFDTPSNLLNLHKSGPNQQSALNIKKARAEASSGDVDESICIYQNSGEFKSLKYYIPEVDFVVVRMQLLKNDFIILLAKNYILYFKWEFDDLTNVTMLAAIRRDMFQDFSQIKFKKKLLQYSVVNDDSFKSSPPLAYIDFKLGCTQHGDDFILNKSIFSNETLRGNSRRFELYGIFTSEAIETLISQTGCPVYVRRVIECSDLKFFYARCFISKSYVNYVFDEFIKLGMENCRPIHNGMSCNMVMWSQRKKFHLIYHTFFGIGKMLKCDLEIIKMHLKSNLINYRYIMQTGQIDSVPMCEHTGMTYFDIACSVYDAVEDDYNNTKFTTIKSKNVGPLVNAVSVRCCENVTNQKYYDKEFDVFTTYLSSLLNLPNYTGSYNDVNTMKIV